MFCSALGKRWHFLGAKEKSTYHQQVMNNGQMDGWAE
jgi:hypothetical protein